jgi:hypothetical protein
VRAVAVPVILAGRAHSGGFGALTSIVGVVPRLRHGRQRREVAVAITAGSMALAERVEIEVGPYPEAELAASG